MAGGDEPRNLWEARYERVRSGRTSWTERESDRRTPGQRDRDRILYTQAFRRLAGITQVVSPVEGHIVHNRLTHTLEVAQIGRRIAERLLADPGQRDLAYSLEGLNPDVVEAAALAHDLGHPPFGHIAEKELQRLLQTFHRELTGSFEGNAQSFRIVNTLAVHRYRDDPDVDYLGLDLTRATLNAILKYPRARFGGGQEYRKWGVYETETEELNWAREGPFALGDGQSTEAEIMDWSDDIAYSVHDMEDFYRAGMIPLERLRGEKSRERDEFLDSAMERRRREGKDKEYPEQELKDAFVQLFRIVPVLEPYTGTRRQRGQIRSFTSDLIDRFVGATRLTDGEPGQRVSKGQSGDRTKEMQVAMLKELTWHYVVHNPALATQQHGQRRAIQTLLHLFTRATEHEDSFDLFPANYRERLQQIASGTPLPSLKTRTAVDYVASLTEQQTLDLFRRVTGQSPGSVIGWTGA